MKKFSIKCLSVVMVVSSLSGGASAEQLNFKYATNGTIPSSVVIAGWEADGTELYACVTPHLGGAHPGKIRHGFNGCYIGYGGQELSGWEYEVIAGDGYWTWAEWPGHIPNRAFEVGREADGQPLYTCRAEYANGMHPGKVRHGFSGCNIAYGGQEITVSRYEVLEY